MTTAQLQQDEGTAATVGALLDRRVRPLRATSARANRARLREAFRADWEARNAK